MQLRTCHFWLLFVILSTSLFAQPKWAKAAIENYNASGIDKDAAAHVILNHLDVEIKDKPEARLKRKQLYKILKSDATGLGTVVLPQTPFLKIKKLKGWRITPGGEIQELEKDAQATIGVQEHAGYYDDSKQRVAILTDVSEGDFVAFEWELREEGWTGLFQHFVFQRQYPVKEARLSVKVPKGWALNTSTWRCDEVEYEQVENTHIWTARDFEHQPDEPMAPSWYYLSRRIAFNSHDSTDNKEHQFSDWHAVSRWCEAEYSRPAWSNAAIKAKVDEITDSLDTFEAKLKAIARFNRDDVRYVAVAIGKGRWIPRYASKTFDNRYGDCKDKTTLMRAMLHEIGVTSFPVLAAVNYRVSPALPTPFQFDHCIIAIPIAQEQVSPEIEKAVVNDVLFYDPTDPTTDLGELPWALQGSRVLLGTTRDTVLVQLPYLQPRDFKRVQEATVQMNSDGSFSADVRVVDHGGFATMSRYNNSLTSKKDQIESWRAVLGENVPQVKLENFSSEVIGDSVAVSFRITSKSYVQRTGNFQLFRPDFFNSAEKSPLKSKKRVHPVWFGPPMEHRSKIIWELPEGFSFEADTSRLESSCDGAELSAKIYIDGNQLRYTASESQNGYLVHVDDYDSARKHSRAISKLYGQTVIVNSK